MKAEIGFVADGLSRPLADERLVLFVRAETMTEATLLATFARRLSMHMDVASCELIIEEPAK